MTSTEICPFRIAVPQSDLAERELMGKWQKLVPVGVYSGGAALMKRSAERDNVIAHRPAGNTGNHFVAMELPRAHTADIRTFFAALRD
ncbi:hypothetical protein [Nocardia jejuensis]|uniref:hypothetical protein n=1 Tax=Nocardia jejuensis TaxID=328049 RepID=UPI0012FA4110|nr:hypothetical protein [Nocardia jejuensis]